MEGNAQNPSPLSRDNIVELVSNFYTFLTTYPFLPASTIKTPPSEGWPEEYREIWRKTGKCDEVVDLLAHLPYIDDENWLWYHDTKPINYTSAQSLRLIGGMYKRKGYRFEPSCMKFPAHVFSLTDGKLYGNWLLLDIQAGTITQFSVLGGPSPKGEAEAGDDGWRLYPAKPIGEFFAACQDKMSGASLISSRTYVRV
ncbi:hypothetical protein BDZ45DRAFT_672908 [Acephala macrosclerotiorum]|nr:hypothetical protein BDZ45DRAFT_672908 [Acephala macrosclerotiorum]